MGMTYDQYWYGDPQMVRAFYEAHKLKQKMDDQAAWLQGLYVHQAVAAVISNMWGKTDTKYPSDPYSFEETNNASSEELEKNYAMAYMSNMVIVGKNWGKK